MRWYEHSSISGGNEAVNFTQYWTSDSLMTSIMLSLSPKNITSAATRDVIFISHAYTDMDLALLLKKGLNIAFPSAKIFDSSDPSSTQPRSEWVGQVLEHLQRAAVVVVIATERSMRRTWVWFEAGAAWGSPPNFVTCCIGSMHKSNLPPPFSNYTALSLTDARELELLYRDIGKHFGEPSKLPALEELGVRLGEIEESIVRDQQALEDPLSEERWNWVHSTLNGLNETSLEALRLLLLYGNATDYFALGELKRRGLAQNSSGIFEGLLNTTNLIQNVSGQAVPPRAQPEYHLQWQIKPEFQPFIRRYFLERKRV